jgi:hypothetical protein
VPASWLLYRDTPLQQQHSAQEQYVATTCRLYELGAYPHTLTLEPSSGTVMMETCPKVGLSTCPRSCIACPTSPHNTRPAARYRHAYDTKLAKQRGLRQAGEAPDAGRDGTSHASAARAQRCSARHSRAPSAPPGVSDKGTIALSLAVDPHTTATYMLRLRDPVLPEHVTPLQLLSHGSLPVAWFIQPVLPLVQELPPVAMYSSTSAARWSGAVGATTPTRTCHPDAALSMRSCIASRRDVGSTGSDAIVPLHAEQGAPSTSVRPRSGLSDGSARCSASRTGASAVRLATPPSARRKHVDVGSVNEACHQAHTAAGHTVTPQHRVVGQQ